MLNHKFVARICSNATLFWISALRIYVHSLRNISDGEFIRVNENLVDLYYLGGGLTPVAHQPQLFRLDPLGRMDIAAFKIHVPRIMRVEIVRRGGPGMSREGIGKNFEINRRV